MWDVLAPDHKNVSMGKSCSIIKMTTCDWNSFSLFLEGRNYIFNFLLMTSIQMLGKFSIRQRFPYQTCTEMKTFLPRNSCAINFDFLTFAHDVNSRCAALKSRKTFMCAFRRRRETLKQMEIDKEATKKKVASWCWKLNFHVTIQFPQTARYRKWKFFECTWLIINWISSQVIDFDVSFHSLILIRIETWFISCSYITALSIVNFISSSPGSVNKLEMCQYDYINLIHFCSFNPNT